MAMKIATHAKLEFPPMKHEQWPSALSRDITVAVTTGSRPPEVCGVGDYTEQLCLALCAIGVNARLVHIGRPRLSDLPAIKRKIAETQADLIHIQYPTMGYGRSLVPHLLSSPLIRIPRVVTLHEFSIFKFYWWPAFAAFAWGADARIFSNQIELSAFAANHPLRQGLDVEIPIGSNIPVAPAIKTRSDEVVYFGLIMPNKGLECFLDLAQLSNGGAANRRFLIIGSIPEKFQAFGRRICAKAEMLGIHVELNLPPAQVARRLAAAQFAYLPFPAGACPKRGSMIAALVNGTVVLTRHAANTPDWLRGATVHVESPQDALMKIKQLSADNQERLRVVSAARLLNERFSWPAIAAAHKSLYLSVLRATASK